MGSFDCLESHLKTGRFPWSLDRPTRSGFQTEFPEREGASLQAMIIAFSEEIGEELNLSFPW